MVPLVLDDLLRLLRVYNYETITRTMLLEMEAKVRDFAERRYLALDAEYYLANITIEGRTIAEYRQFLDDPSTPFTTVCPACDGEGQVWNDPIGHTLYPNYPLPCLNCMGKRRL